MESKNYAQFSESEKCLFTLLPVISGADACRSVGVSLADHVLPCIIVFSVFHVTGCQDVNEDVNFACYTDNQK